MTLLLAIDTAASPWGFAVAGAAGLVGEYLIAKAPTETLVDHLRTVLPLWRVEQSDIGAIAIVTGPGHYMGVRGGVTAAKTLAQVWQVPLIPLDAATALGLQAPLGVRVSPVLDVRRGEVYTGIGRRGEHGIVWERPLAVVPWPEWRETLIGAGDVLVLGALSPGMQTDLAAHGHVQTVHPALPAVRPAVVALEGWRLFQTGQTASYLDVEPMYVRAAVP